MDWTGKWIWDSGEESPYNYFLYARKQFDVNGPVKVSPLRVTADNRYKLYVNGWFLGRGPIRSHLGRYHYDEYDIAPYLQPGANVIALVVHHYGDWTFAAIRARGGILVDGTIEPKEGTAQNLGTNSTWKLMSAPTWRRDQPRTDLQLPFPETFDARLDLVGWNRPEFDDQSWQNAHEIASPGDQPWGELLPRDIPFLREKLLKPESILQIGESKPLTQEALDLDRILGYQYRDRVLGYAATYVYAPEALTASIHTGSTGALRLWVNDQLVINFNDWREAVPDQDVVDVKLQQGWNRILAKVQRNEMAWELVFEAKASSMDLLLSADRQLNGDSARWKLIGPFPLEMDTAFGPESDLYFDQTHTGKHGSVQWVSVMKQQVEPSAVSEIMAWETAEPVSGAKIENPAALTGQSQGVTTLQTQGDKSVVLVLDFGVEVTGYPRIKLKAPAGGIIDLGGGEELMAGRVNPNRASVRNAVRFITREGEQEWESFNPLAFRYLQVSLRHFNEPVEIETIGLNLSIYPFELKGSFECSDPLLNRIYEVGAWTVMMSTEDTFEDCPWRERGQWLGDARIEALISYYAFGDPRAAARSLRSYAEGQHPEGLVPGITPTEFQLQLLPTFSLIWVMMLEDYYRFTGDESLLKELYPNLIRQMDWFKPHVSDTGLLKDLPHWVFVDWASVASHGESASVNALYYQALASSAVVAEAVNDPARAREFHIAAEAVKAAINNRLWDKAKGAYIDTIENGTDRVTRYSQQANSLMVLFGIAHRLRWKSIFNVMLNDQDPEVVIAGSPYFMAYVLEALYRAGYAEEALRRTRDLYGWMLSLGATTWWEQTNDFHSLCHGWSASPTRDFPAEILGIKPVKPGFEEFEVAPKRLDLRWAKGKMATRKGDISVRWALDERGNFFGMQVMVPEGTLAHLEVPIIDLPDPVVMVDGRLVEARVVAGETVRVERLEPGFHVAEVKNRTLHEHGPNQWTPTSQS